MVELIRRCSMHEGIHSIATFDFSTLFTNLEHSIVKNQLFRIIDICFKNAGKQRLAISQYKCFYTDGSLVLGYKVLCKDDIKLLADLVLDNTYVSFAGFVFRQTKGVPMGGNSSPAIADLTLVGLEQTFIHNPIYNHFARICKFVARYIDDLVIINCADFLVIARNIYPASLTLEETSTPDRAPFLDLDLQLRGDQVVHSVYNKTDNFNFNVIRYGFADSNVHTTVTLRVFYGEIIRFSRLCSDLFHFESRLVELVQVFLTHGFCRSSLVQQFCKFTVNYHIALARLGIVDRIQIAALTARLFQR